MIYSDFSSLVGKTPLLEASRLAKRENIQARLLLKLEFFNPAGSVKDRVAVNMLRKARQSGLPEDAQAANDFSNMIGRFEKKIHDLELTRTIAVQMAPQIRLVQNNDTLMIEKIQSSLVNTIPLWKSQMVLALGLEHSRQATAAQSAVTQMTNELLKKNAETLKMGTIATAKEAERSIVDIETLQHTNQQLISTLDEVLRIFKEHYFLKPAHLAVSEMHFYRKGKTVETEITFTRDDISATVKAVGNGSLNAVSNALKEFTGQTYSLEVYTEHSMQDKSSRSVAAAYIGIVDPQGVMHWGAGTDTDIIHASVNALLSAFNNMITNDHPEA